MIKLLFPVAHNHNCCCGDSTENKAETTRDRCPGDYLLSCASFHIMGYRAHRYCSDGTLTGVLPGRYWDKIWHLKYIFYWLAPDTFIFPELTCTFHFASLILLSSSFVIWRNPVHDTELWPDGLIQEDMKLCMVVFICVQKSLSIN